MSRLWRTRRAARMRVLPPVLAAHTCRPGPSCGPGRPPSWLLHGFDPWLSPGERNTPRPARARDRLDQTLGRAWSLLLRGVQGTPRGPGEEGPGGLAGSRVENRGQWGQGPLDIPDPNALFWDAQTAADKSSCPTRRGVWSMARLLVDCPPLIRMLILKGDKQRGPSLPPWPRSQR